jgi:hypothetical protein
MPYQGAKTRYARAISDVCSLARPDASILVDLSPWSEALTSLACRWLRDPIAERLEQLCRDDPRDAWTRFTKEPIPSDRVERVTRFLALQRWSFRGKPVWGRGGHWGTPGYSTTDMYGVPATERFGAVKPQLESLLRRVRSFQSLPMVGLTADVRDVEPGDWVLPGSTTVYFDPPYSGTTGYLDADLTRCEVLEVAERWRAHGARVVVSEAEPLPLSGWQHIDITSRRTGRRSSVSAH